MPPALFHPGERPATGTLAHDLIDQRGPASRAVITSRIRERGCPVREVAQRDHIAEATIIGTAIARFSGAARRQGASSLPVLSLDP